jgi:1-phosphofructokinase
VAEGFTLHDSQPVGRLLDWLAADIVPGDIVTLNGSLPKGVDVATWARFAEVADNLGAYVVLDVQGDALLRATDSRARVQVCKPNEEEAAALLPAQPCGRMERGVLALQELRARGVGLPIVSMGAEGIVYARADGTWRARCPVRQVRIPVGAGDAMVAGIAVAFASGLESDGIIRLGLSAAAAHVEGVDIANLGTRAAELVPVVEVTPLAL